MKWIRAKYFKQVRSRQGVFAVNTGKLALDGEPELLSLRKAADSKIQRHIKIKAEANPYDPQWEIYFEKRWNSKMKNTFKGSWKLANIWGNQQGLCSVCQQKITLESMWHTHHIQPRCEGGKDSVGNLLIVHPNCHRQIHSQGLTVVKSASLAERH